MKRLTTLSQHFLRSPIIVKKLIGHTNIKKTDVVYDIGAGSGVVASALAGAAKEVVALELDARLIPTLQTNLQKFANVIVRQADFFATPLPQTPFKVFANIPFSLSARIVARLGFEPSGLHAAYLIVQEQFARRLLPDNPGYSSQLGIKLGVNFTVRIRYRLQPADFYPRPNVPTVLLELLPRPEPLLAARQQPIFNQFIEQCFTQPQKFWQYPLSAMGFAPKISPSKLTLEQWVALFNIIKS